MTDESKPPEPGQSQAERRKESGDIIGGALRAANRWLHEIPKWLQAILGTLFFILVLCLFAQIPFAKWVEAAARSVLHNYEAKANAELTMASSDAEAKRALVKAAAEQESSERVDIIKLLKGMVDDAKQEAKAARSDQAQTLAAVQQLDIFVRGAIAAEDIKVAGLDVRVKRVEDQLGITTRSGAATSNRLDRLQQQFEHPYPPALPAAPPKK